MNGHLQIALAIYSTSTNNVSATPYTSTTNRWFNCVEVLHITIPHFFSTTQRNFSTGSTNSEFVPVLTMNQNTEIYDVANCLLLRFGTGRLFLQPSKSGTTRIKPENMTIISPSFKHTFRFPHSVGYGQTLQINKSCLFLKILQN